MGTSYRAQLEYTGDRFASVLDFINVDPSFNPEAGYVRRHNVRRAHTLLRSTHRRGADTLIRNHDITDRISYFTDTAWRIAEPGPAAGLRDELPER